MLRLFGLEQFRRGDYSGLWNPNSVVLNPFDLQFVFASTVFLIVFFDSHAGISLRGEVNRVCTVDNQRRRGAAIAGFRSC